MKTRLLTGLLVAAATTSALAQRNNASQHPRVGQLAELAFAPGSAEVVFDTNGKVAAKLDQAASWAHENPDGLVVLDGHADPVGTEPANFQLSLQRAKAVRERLIAAGVDPDQIIIAAFGEDGPRRDRSVVVWATRTGERAVVARTLRRGGDLGELID
jgi:outer membrane protein OmpA-like peptidoglycan-associated protein